MKTVQVHSGYAQIYCDDLGRDVSLVGDVLREYSGGNLKDESTVWKQCSGARECRQNPMNCACSGAADNLLGDKSLR